MSPPILNLRFVRQIICVAVLSLFGAHTAIGASTDGQFDLSFGSSGRSLISLYGFANNTAATVLETAAGKLIVGGACDDICIARLLPDGTFDKSFGPDGFGYVDFNSFPSVPVAVLSDATLLPDGRIAILGIYAPGAATVANVYILRADGSGLDTSVGGGSGLLMHVFADNEVFGTIGKIRAQADGELLVAATQARSVGGEFLMVARVLPDLSGLDSSFGTSGVATVGFGLNGPGQNNFDYLSDLALQADGKILVGGSSNTNTGQFYMEIARLLPNGQRDSSFGPAADGRFYEGGSDVYYEETFLAVDLQQNIVYGSGVRATEDNWVVGRLLAAGQHDPSFNGGTEKQFRINADGPQTVKSIVATNDSIIASGFVPRSTGADDYFVGVARLNRDGTLAASFGIGGGSYASFAPPDMSTVSDQAVSVIVTKLGIVVAGTAQTSDYDQIGILRLQYDHIFGDSFD